MSQGQFTAYDTVVIDVTKSVLPELVFDETFRRFMARTELNCTHK